MAEKKKRFNILRLSDKTQEIWLCSSDPNLTPDEKGGGYYRSHSSFVWVKAGEKETWKRTSFRSIRKAMDALLHQSIDTAEKGVDRLMMSDN